MSKSKMGRFIDRRPNTFPRPKITEEEQCRRDFLKYWFRRSSERYPVLARVEDGEYRIWMSTAAKRHFDTTWGWSDFWQEHPVKLTIAKVGYCRVCERSPKVIEDCPGCQGEVMVLA